MKFSVGDRVRIVRSALAGRVGTVTTITSPLRPAKVVTPNNGWFGVLESGHPVHELDIRGEMRDGSPSPANAVYPPEYLEPAYDGHEKTSWSECVWQPNQVRA